MISAAGSAAADSSAASTMPSDGTTDATVSVPAACDTWDSLLLQPPNHVQQVPHASAVGFATFKDVVQDVVASLDDNGIKSHAAARDRLRRLVQGACAWPSPSDAEKVTLLERDPAKPMWPLGARLRSAVALANDGKGYPWTVDCTVADAPAVTLHHQVAPIRSSNLRHPLGAPVEMLRSMMPSPFAGPPSKESPGKETPMRVRATSERVTTTYTRVKQGSWVELTDVCMTCEPRREFFMTTGRACYPTLWALGDDATRLASRGRGMSARRHSLFAGREGSFQYGGFLLDPPSDAHWVRGTSLYAAPFAADNVGHVLHDAVFGLAGGLSIISAWLGHDAAGRKAIQSRMSKLFGPPFQIVVDDDVVGASSEFYQFTLAAMLLGWNFSSDSAASSREAPQTPPASKNTATTSSRLTLPLIVTPLSQEMSRLRHRNDPSVYSLEATVSGVIAHATVASIPPNAVVAGKGQPQTKRPTCFDSLLVTGLDRLGSGTRLISRAAIAAQLRAAVLSVVRDTLRPHNKNKGDGPGNEPDASNSLTAPVPARRPQMYVYARRDIHRRSLDNPGWVLHVAHAIARELHLPAPRLVASFSAAPAAQVALAAGMDLLITAQGAHEQVASLFMPLDAAIIEVAPCGGKKTSFVGRYGPFHPEQRLHQVHVCAPMINLSDDMLEQNVTLCPQHIVGLRDAVHEHALRILRSRGLSK
jgi:hypothetical protein